MATLTIQKLSAKTWKHTPSDGLSYILTKFYVKSNGDKIRVCEFNGALRSEYLYSDVIVYDIGGTPETFATIDDLMQRLEALDYTGFFNEGGVTPVSLISSDADNIIELGTDNKLFAKSNSEKHLYAHYGFIYTDTLFWQTSFRPSGQSFLTTLSANSLFGSGATPTNITISNTINLADATKINKINFSYFLNSGTANLHVYIVVSDKNNSNTQVLVDEVLASNSTNGTFCKQLNLNAHTILNADSKLRFFIRSTTGVPEAIYDIQTRYTYE